MGKTVEGSGSGLTYLEDVRRNYERNVFLIPSLPSEI